MDNGTSRMTGGGYIGAGGDPGGDAAPVVLAPGELWLTRAMLAHIERVNPGALADKIVHVIDAEQEA